MSWRQEFIEATDWKQVANLADEANHTITEKQRRLITMRRDNADYFSSNKQTPAALRRRELFIVAGLWQRWAAERGQPGTPTNDDTRQRAIDAALDQDAEYCRIKQECLQCQAAADDLEAQIDDEKRHHTATILAWKQNIAFLYPDPAEGA